MTLFLAAKGIFFVPKKGLRRQKKTSLRKQTPSASNNQQVYRFTTKSSKYSTVSSGASSAHSNVAPPPTIDVNNGTCEAEGFLLEQSNKLSVLFTLCIGLEERAGDDGSKIPLMDLNKSPFKHMKKKKDIKPSLDSLREEVKRRSERDNTNANKPKPNRWNAKKCHDWLKANPITNIDDVAFLFRKAKVAKQVVENATQRTVVPTVSVDQPEGEQGNKWFGSLPYLRLVHCLMEDNIRDKWMHRNDPKSIQEIDARRSDVRAETVFEMIANRWNSKSFNPMTMIMTACHADYFVEIDVGFESMADFARASPTKVKDK